MGDGCEGAVGGAGALVVLEVAEGVGLLGGELVFFEGEVDGAGEEGVVGCGHFLSGEDEAAVHGSLCAAAVAVHVHFEAAAGLVGAFEHADDFWGDVVLELVEVYESVVELGHVVADGGLGAGLEGGALVGVAEEA